MRKSGAGARKRSLMGRSSGIPRPSHQFRPSSSMVPSVPASSRKPATGGRGIAFRLPSAGKASLEMGLFRPSTIGVSSKGPVKDPRKLNDRDYQNTLIRKLQNFLLKTRYKGETSLSSLRCPKSKDFLYMFQHVFALLSPAEKISDKFSEEIPSLLKSTGYPFNVSSKALLSVGNPHTWSQLLGVFSWLIDLITMTSHIGGESLLFPAELFDDGTPDCPSSLEAEFDETANYYKLYMDGHIDLKGGQLEEMLGRDKEERCQAVKRERRKLDEAIEKLEDEMKSLACGPSLESALERHAILKEDKKKFEDYVEKLEQRLEGHDQRALEAAIKSKEDCELEVKEAYERKQQLEACIGEQRVTKEEMESLMADKSSLMNQWRALSSSSENHKQESAALDMKYSKVVGKVEKMAGHYNKEALALALIPLSAANAKGRDLELRFDLSMGSSSHSEEDIVRIRRTVIPGLNSVQEDLMLASQQLKSQRFACQETCEKLESETNSRRRRKKRWDVEAASLQGEIQRLEKELQETAQQNSEHYALMLTEKQTLKSSALSQELQQAEADYKKLQIDIHHKEKALMEQEAEDAATSARIQGFIEQMLAECERVMVAHAHDIAEEHEALEGIPSALKMIKQYAAKRKASKDAEKGQ
eukprot:m.98249 g.98249  ORF g.98249 m.98249 type:complete len:645 (+) comp36974_c0_seq1:62-1996(+)